MNESLIYQGAEAKLIRSTYLGLHVVCKHRLQKRYRIKEIDNRLIQTRTRDEAKLMSLARKAGVNVPLIYDIDLNEGTLIMQLINGNRIKDIYNSLSLKKRKELCRQMGGSIARLHNNDIIHGDITTSNMMFEENRIFFIDFGLGEINPDIEAKGVDLHVLMEAMESTHSTYASDFSFVMQGYEATYSDDVTSVKNKINDIIRRGRYR